MKCRKYERIDDGRMEENERVTYKLHDIRHGRKGLVIEGVDFSLPPTCQRPMRAKEGRTCHISICNLRKSHVCNHHWSDISRTYEARRSIRVSMDLRHDLRVTFLSYSDRLKMIPLRKPSGHTTITVSGKDVTLSVKVR